MSMFPNNGIGALLDCGIAPCRGKGNDEQSLLRTILDDIQRTDVLLGDAFYAIYFLICALMDMGVDGVLEQLHGAWRHTTDFSTGERLGSKDHIVECKKPNTKPAWMDQ